MKHRRITVTARDGSTTEVAADLMKCDACDGDVFFALMLVDAAHPHLQCVRCETTFCCGGCESPQGRPS